MIAVWLMGTRLASIFMKGSLGEIMYAGITRAQQNPISLIIIVEMIASTSPPAVWICQVDFWILSPTMPTLLA